MWGLWLAVHVVVFSFMSGIIHSYYVVVLAPAIGALVGGGLTELWAIRGRNPRLPWAGIVLAAGLVGSAAVAWLLLDRTPDFAPGLGIGVVAVAVAAALILAVPARLLPRPIQLGAIVLGLAVLLGGPAAYALDTMQAAYKGGDPSAGPQVAGTGGAFSGGSGGQRPGGQPPNSVTPGAAPAGAPALGGRGAFAGGGPNAEAASSTVTDFLVAHRGSARWIVAVSSANQAGSIELATGEPVMAMGGFSGSDPAPTLEQLRSAIASGALRYVIVGGQGGGPGGGTSEISTWVTTTCAAVTDVSSTLYDCSGATTAGS